MPRDDVSAIVSALPLPKRGAPPPPVDRISVAEIGAASDCGCIERHALVGWFYGGDVPVRRFRIYLRRADDDAWEDVGQAVEQTKTLCCGLGLGIDYVVAVVAEGPDGAALPPSAASVAEFRLYGLEPVPDAPANARLLRADGSVVLTWDPIEYPSPIEYEVRSGGANWGGARLEARTRSTWIELGHVLPGGALTTDFPLTFLVAAVTATGLRGTAAEIADEVIETAPDHLVAGQSDTGSSWLGSKTRCAVVAGRLVVNAGETSAVYEAGSIDVGTVGEHVVVAAVKGGIYGLGETWCMCVWRWNSAEAAARDWDGSPAAREWFPAEDIAWPGPPTWDELTDTWDSLDWMIWDSYAEPRDPDDPAAMTWDDAEFEWDSVFADSWTWDGPVSSSGTGYVLEIQSSTDGATYTDWATYAPVSRTFRYLRWRLRITQPVPALAVEFDRVAVAVLRPRAVARLGLSWVIREGASPTDLIFYRVSAAGTETEAFRFTSTALKPVSSGEFSLGSDPSEKVGLHGEAVAQETGWTGGAGTNRSIDGSSTTTEVRSGLSTLINALIAKGIIGA